MIGPLLSRWRCVVKLHCYDLTIYMEMRYIPLYILNQMTYFRYVRLYPTAGPGNDLESKDKILNKINGKTGSWLFRQVAVHRTGSDVIQWTPVVLLMHGEACGVCLKKHNQTSKLYEKWVNPFQSQVFRPRTLD